MPACTAPGDPLAPHGLFVLAGAQPIARSALGPAIQKYLVGNPDVCGAAVFVNWSSVDPGPEADPRYEWTSVDALVAPWAQARKIVNIELNGTGYEGDVLHAVPSYVQAQVQTVACGKDVAPVYWQTGYEASWQRFVSAFVQHYDSNPNIGYIHIGVGTGAQTLIVGTRSASCLSKWNAVGYQTQWPVYVRQMITFAASLHSRKQLLIGFNDYANEPPADEIAQWDAGTGIGFGFGGLQASDVSAYAAHQACGKTNWCALYKQYAGRMPLFVQTLGQSFPGPEVGTSLVPTFAAAQATGPLPPLLETALAVHTQIFEIYAQDWLLAFDPGSAGYASYHTTYAQALARAAAVVGTAGGAAPQIGPDLRA